MNKCTICRATDNLEAWQPFGPDESPMSFMALGWHYRGFPVLTVCNLCKRNIQAWNAVEFTCNGERYILDALNERIVHVPAYVGDALLWLEETGGERR